MQKGPDLLHVKLKFKHKKIQQQVLLDFLTKI